MNWYYRERDLWQAFLILVIVLIVVGCLGYMASELLQMSRIAEVAAPLLGNAP